MKYIVSIKLHPLAWKVLRTQYHYDGVAVDVGRGWLYNVIALSLVRNPVISPWEFNRAPKGMVEGRVYIHEYDYNRYGGYISLPMQANISVILFKRERERLCSLTAAAHVMGGMGRDTAMRYFLEKEGYEDDEISFAALRKHYQRHYRQHEEDMLQNFNELAKITRHKTRQ